jgi:GDP-L-fucose synthase
MPTSSKIFISSHPGLVGSVLTRKLHEKGFSNLVERPRNQLDLTTDQPGFDKFFE